MLELSIKMIEDIMNKLTERHRGRNDNREKRIRDKVKDEERIV
jgi:hypothetical protein